MTMKERIENAIVDACMEFKEVTEIHLGKSEYTQFKQDYTDQGQLSIRKDRWTVNEGFTYIIPSDAESEFRVVTESSKEGEEMLRLLGRGEKL